MRAETYRRWLLYQCTKLNCSLHYFRCVERRMLDRWFFLMCSHANSDWFVILTRICAVQKTYFSLIPELSRDEPEEPSQTKNVMNVLFSFASCATNEDPNFSYFLRNLYDTQMRAQTELAIARKPSKFFNSIQIDASSIVSFFRFFFVFHWKPYFNMSSFKDLVRHTCIYWNVSRRYA